MRTLLLFIAFVLLLGGVFFLLSQDDDTATSGTTSEQGFAVENPEQVTKIYITDKDGNDAVLEKKENYWKLNDRYKAMQPKVDQLLETLGALSVSGLVDQAVRKTVLTELATRSKKVEIYFNNEKQPGKVYYIGLPPTNGSGNYMLMKIGTQNAEQPYLVRIPGLVGRIDTRYIIDEEEWRDKTVFNIPFDRIKQVTVKYPKRASQSFQIQNPGNEDYKVLQGEGVKSEFTNFWKFNPPAPGLEVYKTSVSKYLSSFEHLNAETIINDYSKRDSIIKTKPFAEIVVEKTSGDIAKLQIFYKDVDERTKHQFTESGETIPYDLDRYFALFNGGRDFGIIQHYVFGKLFRQYKDFVRNPL